MMYKICSLFLALLLILTLGAPVLAAEVAEATETTEATEAAAPEVQVIVLEDDRPFLSTSFEEYTVTEGFLLLIFVITLFSFFLGLFRG